MTYGSLAPEFLLSATTLLSCSRQLEGPKEVFMKAGIFTQRLKEEDEWYLDVLTWKEAHSRQSKLCEGSWEASILGAVVS